MSEHNKVSRKALSASIDKGTYDALVAYRWENRLSLSAAVEQAINAFLGIEIETMDDSATIDE